MDRLGFIGIFVMLIIIASGISRVSGALAGIASDLQKIREEVEGLRRNLHRDRHSSDEPDPFS